MKSRSKVSTVLVTPSMESPSGKTIFSSAFSYFSTNALLKFCFLIAGVLSFSVSNAQSRTITSAGAWSSTTIWSGGLIADAIGENTTINNNQGTITVGTDYTVGSIDMNSGNTLTISSGVIFNVGQSGVPKNLSSANTATINVIGTLIIWGDLVVGNNLDLNVSAGGTLIIKGNVTLGTGGDLVISGNVQIDGNFTGANDTDLIVNGSVTVGGNLSVGNNSDPSGSGTVSVGGTCSDGSSAFCGVGPLPIKLISFSDNILANGISIDWVTSTEKDFDYFLLERAPSTLDFKAITQVEGKGGLDMTTSYSFLDISPNSGKNYYRLKSVDLDGTFTYSNVILAEWSSNSNVNIYPNPIQNRSFSIDLSDAVTSPETVGVYESRGYLVFETPITSMRSTIDLPENIKSGVYLVKVTSSGGQHVSRIVVP